DTLVNHVQDNLNDSVLILAGYHYEIERFLDLNPGLKSRFPFIIDIGDYSVDELIKIARQMARERECQHTKGAEWKLKANLYKQRQNTVQHFSNARYVRNMIE